ncbi:MAG: class I SAM-dependent methyltransferase [Chloroflexota bacterium]|nr:class I SAM-dependent methyltransferase [Chloroflexota bacterium]
MPLIHNQVAQLYDRARPGYPAALFDDIVRYADLADDARVLEVGCGSGQATLPMAQRGYIMDCLEPGAEMAAIARAKLASFPKVNVTCASFEAYGCPPATYNLLLSATAFHWTDPRIRFQKAHELLTEYGALALFWHRPAQTDASRDFFNAVQEIYQAVAPELTSDYVMPPPPEAVATEFESLIPGSGYFGDLKIRRHYVATKYSARAYIDLLGTFSDHQTLDELKRQRLFLAVESLINDSFAGTIIRETVALLYLARRR